MATVDTQPTNVNFLSPLGFKLQIKKLPTVEYFVQSVTVPSVSLGQADVDTPFTKIPLPGTRLTYGNLAVEFKVDEDLKNYLEIYNWLRGIGFPDNFAEYSNMARLGYTTGEGVYSDISLTVLSSAMNPTNIFKCIDCFPIDISSLSFDSTSADVEYITATATFAIRRFDVEPII